MPRRSPPSLLLALAIAGCSSAAASGEDEGPGGDPIGIDPYYPEAPVFDPDGVVDGGSLSVPERPRRQDAAPSNEADGGALEPPPDAGPPPLCAPIGPGSLRIVELMIKSIDGSGDRAEWVELLNPNACTLQVPFGLKISSPRGTSSDTAAVDNAFELPPHAAFLAGGDGAPLHTSLPTLRWQAADTLKNTGDAVTVTLMDGTLIDTLTYPAFNNLTARRSIAFPSDCAADRRADFQNWSASFALADPLTATPFLPNDDVTCLP